MGYHYAFIFTLAPSRNFFERSFSVSIGFHASLRTWNGGWWDHASLRTWYGGRDGRMIGIGFHATLRAWEGGWRKAGIRPCNEEHEKVGSVRRVKVFAWLMRHTLFRPPARPPGLLLASWQQAFS